MRIVFDEDDISDIHPDLKKRMETYHFELTGWSKKIGTRKVKDGDIYHTEVNLEEPQTWELRMKTTKTQGELIEEKA